MAKSAKPPAEQHSFSGKLTVSCARRRLNPPKALHYALSSLKLRGARTPTAPEILRPGLLPRSTVASMCWFDLKLLPKTIEGTDSV
jgi:hypothetical protein